MKKAILLFVLLGNLWIFKIFSSAFLLSLLLFAATLCLYFLLEGKRVFKFIFWVLFSILLVAQITTTQKTSLTLLSNDQIRIRDTRLGQYPPVSIRVFGKTVWIPVAHWFEGRKESIAFFRVMKNFSEAIDPSIYFFASHPRERVGVREFEKFPYIFFPFFVWGLLGIAKKARGLILSVFIIPVVLVSILGHTNKLGTFSLFPFFGVVTSWGLYSFFEFVVRKHKISPARFVAVGFAVFLLVFAQVLSYAQN